MYVKGIAYNNCQFTCICLCQEKNVSKYIFCRFYQSGSHMTVYPMLISRRVIHQPFNKRMYRVSHLGLQKLILHLNQYFVLSKLQTPEVVSVRKIDISNLYCFLWFVHVLYFHATSHIIFAELNNFSWSLTTSFIHPPHITTSKENFQTLTSNSILFYVHIMIIHV